jgi:hypothetical protein
MEKPKHYTKRTIAGNDVIDMIKVLDLNFNQGNILKYLLRDKGQDKSDLMKIIDYAQRELNYITEQQNKVSNHKLFRNEKN